jgi:hypothetical protein
MRRVRARHRHPVRLAGGWWLKLIVLREKYCYLVVDGWFVLREKYCWLVVDKLSEQAAQGCARYGTVRRDHESPAGTAARQGISKRQRSRALICKRDDTSVCLSTRDPGWRVCHYHFMDSFIRDSNRPE